MMTYSNEDIAVVRDTIKPNASLLRTSSLLAEASTASKLAMSLIDLATRFIENTAVFEDSENKVIAVETMSEQIKNTTLLGCEFQPSDDSIELVEDKAHELAKFIQNNIIGFGQRHYLWG